MDEYQGHVRTRCTNCADVGKSEDNRRAITNSSGRPYNADLAGRKRPSSTGLMGSRVEHNPDPEKPHRFIGIGDQTEDEESSSESPLPRRKAESHTIDNADLRGSQVAPQQLVATSKSSAIPASAVPHIPTRAAVPGLPKPSTRQHVVPKPSSVAASAPADELRAGHAGAAGAYAQPGLFHTRRNQPAEIRPQTTGTES